MVDFLVIGPFSAVTYNNIFPLIKDGVVRLGRSRVSEFTDGTKFGNIVWFSNISYHCPPMLELRKQYNEVDYPKFDNYDAINVDRTEDIPYDYDGVMGVPITYLEKWNPDQFDIVGFLKTGCFFDNKGLQGGNGVHMTMVNGEYKYIRVLIKRK